MVCSRSSGFESVTAESVVSVVGLVGSSMSGSTVRYEVFSIASASTPCCSARSRPRSSLACVLLVVVASFRNLVVWCRVPHRGQMAVSGSGVMIHNPEHSVQPTTA